MSLTRTIQSAVDKAFNAVGDLKKTGQLFGPKVSNYDLSTGSVVERVEKSAIVDVILENSSKSDDSTTVYKAILKSGPNMSVYKTLKIGSVNYRITSYEDNDFIINLNLAREE